MTTSPSAIKKKITTKYGTLFSFSIKCNLSSDQLYRCFKAPYTKQKLTRLSEVEKMIDTDPVAPVSKIKARKLIKIYFRSVFAFCRENSFTYPHVIRYLEGTITRLHPNIEAFLAELKNKHDKTLNLESF